MNIDVICCQEVIELILLDNKVKIGYCRVNTKDSVAEVDVIRVAKPYRRRGLATLLLLRVEELGFIVTFPDEDHLSNNGKSLEQSYVKRTKGQ